MATALSFLISFPAVGGMKGYSRSAGNRSETGGLTRLEKPLEFTSPGDSAGSKGQH